MKLLLVILTTLIILISIFLILLNENIKLRRKKRAMIFDQKFKIPRVKSVSFAEEIVQTMPVKQPWGYGRGYTHLGDSHLGDSPGHTPMVGAVLVDEYGKDQLLNFDSFVDNYYSQKDITKFKQIYEAEALDITNRYKTEDFVYKKESDRFQFH